MRLLPWLVVLGLACAPAAEEPGPAVTQQPVLLPVDTNQGTTGSPGDELGTSLAACAPSLNQVVVAGAPGLAGAWRVPAGPLPRAGDAGFGAVVGCVGADGVVVGGPSGLLRLNGTAWTAIDTSQPYTAMTSAPGLPTLAAGAGPVFRLMTTGGSTPVTVLGASNVRALLWLSGSAFAVTNGTNGGATSVALYHWDGGVPTVRKTFPGGAVAGLGRALALGDVTPVNPGPELIIGAEGQVLIYSLGGAHLNTLTGTATFGTSLVIEPGVFTQLDALWVGEPGENTVHRFIGDAGESLPLNVVGSAAFGQSLAISEQRQLFIGAPAFPDGPQSNGAVFTYTPARSAMVAQVQLCGAQGSSCPNINCSPATCLGGVVCLAPLMPSACPSGMVCVGNICKAPLPAADAGMQVDAGEIVDAGVITDAGLAPGDAGVEPERIQFTSCGCSGGAAVPTLMLGLLLTRRWRRRCND